MAEKGSDLTFDFCCNICEEDGVKKEAICYCQQCSKSLCGDCIGMHKQLFKQHVVFEREEIDKWPVTSKLFDDLRFCKHHKDHLIEMYCEDHSKLCCSMCLFHDHRHCVKLKLLQEKTQAFHDVGVFNELSAAIADAQQKLQSAKEEKQDCRKKLQDSYEKAYEEIKRLRQKINDIIDEWERKTIFSLDNLFQTLNQHLQSDIDSCTNTTHCLNKIGDALNKIEHCPKDVYFIAYQKALGMVSQAETLLKELTVSRSPLVVFNSNPYIEQTLSGLSFLGSIECVEKQKDDKIMTIECKNKYCHGVRMLSEKNNCNIKGICELPNGDILISDVNNDRVKLLDTQYKIVAHIDLPASPRNKCSISPTEVAVTVEDGGRTHAVQFLSVNNKQILKGRTLYFRHACYGIAHFNGSLFITSSKVLYKYTLGGQLVKKIYEDTSSDLTVYRCAVSADGSCLYVTNCICNKLITLSIDVTVLSSLEDPALDHPTGVHVSETGLLMVSGYNSHNVVQVDDKGGVVTMVSKKDGLNFPESVYYSARTGRVIIGHARDNILVIDNV